MLKLFSKNSLRKQEVSPFQAGDHKASIKRKHNTNKTEITQMVHKRSNVFGPCFVMQYLVFLLVMQKRELVALI